MKERFIFSYGGPANKPSRGFTLVELLIVITIIAILSVATVLVLNPSEILKKSRDSQRMSDLGSLKSAISLYLTTVSSPILSGSADEYCVGGATPTIFTSLLSDGTAPTGGQITDASPPAGFSWGQKSTAAAFATDGTGWVPVDLDDTTGGSAIASLPQDPAPHVASNGSLVNTDRFYRYACNINTATSKPSTFELNARLESSYYTTGATSALTSDGGNNTLLYEVGTNLGLMPASDNF